MWILDEAVRFSNGKWVQGFDKMSQDSLHGTLQGVVDIGLAIGMPLWVLLIVGGVLYNSCKFMNGNEVDRLEIVGVTMCTTLGGAALGFLGLPIIFIALYLLLLAFQWCLTFFVGNLVWFGGIGAAGLLMWCVRSINIMKGGTSVKVREQYPSSGVKMPPCKPPMPASDDTEEAESRASLERYIKHLSNYRNGTLNNTPPVKYADC